MAALAATVPTPLIVDTIPIKIIFTVLDLARVASIECM